MSITFDSKFVYIMGISGAYTHEEAKEILSKLSEVVNAAQQSVQRTVGTQCSPTCKFDYLGVHELGCPANSR